MKVKAALAAILLLLCLTGCVETVEVNTDAETPMFVQVEQTSSWKVVYHKETKVMYAVSDGVRSSGTFTVLLNPDGTPMLWEGD